MQRRQAKRQRGVGHNKRHGHAAMHDETHRYVAWKSWNAISAA
jgi:hypothetical protein